MPRLPSLAGVVGRVFGRLDKFDLECPACGEVIRVHYRRARHGKRDQTATELRYRARTSWMWTRKNRKTGTFIYNPYTSRLRCPGCTKIWGLGILLYPVHPTAPPRQPADQRPTLTQLLALRRLAGGFVLDKILKGADEVNVAVVADCTCPESYGGLAMSCPIHGWEATNRVQTREDDPPVSAGESPDREE